MEINANAGPRRASACVVVAQCGSGKAGQRKQVSVRPSFEVL